MVFLSIKEGFSPNNFVTGAKYHITKLPAIVDKCLVTWTLIRLCPEWKANLMITFGFQKPLEALCWSKTKLGKLILSCYLLSSSFLPAACLPGKIYVSCFLQKALYLPRKMDKGVSDAWDYYYYLQACYKGFNGGKGSPQNIIIFVGHFGTSCKIFPFFWQLTSCYAQFMYFSINLISKDLSRKSRILNYIFSYKWHNILGIIVL